MRGLKNPYSPVLVVKKGRPIEHSGNIAPRMRGRGQPAAKTARKSVRKKFPDTDLTDPTNTEKASWPASPDGESC